MNSTIHTPTNDLKQSLEFYNKLGFQVLSKAEPTVLTDGIAVIEINPERAARAGVKLYREDWTEIVDKLEKMTPVMKVDNGYLVVGKSGVWIYLANGDSGIEFTKSETSFSTLGNFYGVSLETISIEASVKIWEVLGFKKFMGDIEKGWVAYMNDDGMGVSFMKPNSCPHLFINPSLSYFNGEKNLEVIQKIRDLKIPIVEEITHFNKEGKVDNIIIRDPGGYGFFIFND